MTSHGESVISSSMLLDVPITVTLAQGQLLLIARVIFTTQNKQTECAANFALQKGQCAELGNFVLLNSAFQAKQFNGVDGWTLSGNVNSLSTSVCGDSTLIGGFNVFGSGAKATKKYEKVLHHTKGLMCHHTLDFVFKFSSTRSIRGIMSSSTSTLMDAVCGRCRSVSPVEVSPSVDAPNPIGTK